jgi:hypothetical protein
MINQDILGTLDSAIDDLNRLYFASFDLTQDERQRFKDSIKKLEDLKQEIKLLFVCEKSRTFARSEEDERSDRPTDTNEQKPQILKQN